MLINNTPEVSVNKTLSGYSPGNSVNRESSGGVIDRFSAGEKNPEIQSTQLNALKSEIAKTKNPGRYPHLSLIKLDRAIDKVLKNHARPSKERDQEILSAFVYHARTSKDMQQYKHLLYSEKTRVSFTCPPVEQLNFKELGNLIDEYSVVYPDIMKYCEQLPQTTFYRWTSSEAKEKECADGKLDYSEVWGRNFDDAVFVATDTVSSSEYGDAMETLTLAPDTKLLNSTNRSPYFQEGFRDILKKHNLKTSSFVFPISMAIKAGVQMIYDDTVFPSYSNWFKILDLNVIESIS